MKRFLITISAIVSLMASGQEWTNVVAGNLRLRWLKTDTNFAGISNWASTSPSSKQNTLTYQPATNGAAIPESQITGLVSDLATKQFGSANLSNWSALAPGAKQDVLQYQPATNSDLIAATNSLNTSLRSALAQTNAPATTQVSKQTDYGVGTGDSIVFLGGNHIATLPTAIGNTNRTYTIVCVTSGTNAIVTTGGQTISGFAKWTNTAVNKFVTVVSNNTNWFVIAASVNP